MRACTIGIEKFGRLIQTVYAYVKHRSMIADASFYDRLTLITSSNLIAICPHSTDTKKYTIGRTHNILTHTWFLDRQVNFQVVFKRKRCNRSHFVVVVVSFAKTTNLHRKNRKFGIRYESSYVIR